MHHRALVARFFGRPVVPPTLAPREQSAFAVGRFRSPHHLPERTDLSVPDPSGIVAIRARVFHVLSPHGFAHLPPRVLERSDAFMRDDLRCSVNLHDEVVRQRSQTRSITLRGVTFPPTFDPPVERIVVDDRLHDFAACLLRAGHGVRRQERQQVGTPP